MKCICKLLDDQFPQEEITHTRKIARAILLNEKNEVLLLHILGDDIFGHRDYFETPGGGVNEDETLQEAVLREIKEETGYESSLIQEIGYVDDYYNKIHRHNLNYYFLLKIKEKGEKHLEEFEKIMFEGMNFYSIDKAIELYENMNTTPIEILVSRRELPILKIAKEMIKKGEN